MFHVAKWLHNPISVGYHTIAIFYNTSFYNKIIIKII